MNAKSNTPTTPAAMLRKIQAEFFAGLRGRIEEIRERWELISEQRGSKKQIQDLHRSVHTITGESATFGFPWVSQAAQQLELSLKRFADGTIRPGRETALLIRRQVQDLEWASQRYSLDRLPDLEGSLIRDVPAQPPIEEKSIFLVDDDEKLARTMAVQLRHYGYRVKVFDNLDEIEKHLEESFPTAIIMDIMLPEGNLAGVEFITALRRLYPKSLRVVFISGRTDMEARLKACRTDCDAYFTKPVDVHALAERLDRLTGRRLENPYEILIVDDNARIANYYAEVLKDAGMKVTVLTDPMIVVDHLAAARPDLILMDLYMPQCTGMELAAVLRQDECFLPIPIVFLSSEKDLDQQIAALGLGGDEFLTKPIDPAHLVATVVPRAERGRLLGSMIYRDALTGLFNHTKQREQLRIELKRASRDGVPLSFVMLDIDQFKTVNDTYGHAMGDRVLSSLACLLKERLRQSDVIARYGGDEFAVVLPGVDTANAMRLFEEIRESFAQLQHLVGDRSFTVTFSCGLSSSPPHHEAEILAEAADRALYEAKRRGRNCVVQVE